MGDKVNMERRERMVGLVMRCLVMTIVIKVASAHRDMGPGGGRRLRNPPKYMMDMYRRYRSGGEGGGREGASVRGILPCNGKIFYI